MKIRRPGRLDFTLPTFSLQAAGSTMRGLFISGILAATAALAPPSRGDDAAFARVRSILTRCTACHNADDASADLDLTNRASALRGGESGAVLVPGDAKASKLHDLVARRKMPPKKPLSPEEIEAVRAWIDSGAKWEGDLSVAREQDDADSPRWAFRPIEPAPTPPIASTNAGGPLDPIDAYLDAALAAKGLAANPPADRSTWIRRVTYDLIGLPPTPEETAAFLADDRPDAHERVVDRLLASPRYGERWARHWLDLARFAESHGFEYDRLRDHAWRYRDYVIDSFNADKPYATFIREQVAGDRIEPVTAEGIIATGFLVAGPWDQAGSGQANLIGRGRVREEELEDMVGVVAQTFLGLTVQCARCHSHKFDPIPQRDYYRIKAALEGVGHGDRDALGAAERRDRDRLRARLDSESKSVEAQLVALERGLRASALAARAEARREPKPRPRPEPDALWTFEVDSRDDLGRLPGTLKGGARVTGGRLILPGAPAHVETAKLPDAVGPKTLEAWVALADLDQRGGAAIGVLAEPGGRFDALVFGEREPRKWVAGSEFFRRTRDLEAPLESAAAGALVHVAVAYDPDGTIRVYRNGKAYGAGYRPEGDDARPLLPKPGTAHVLIGLRHPGAGNGYLKGEVEEARFYARALSEAEVAASFEAGPERIGSEELDRMADPAVRDLRRNLAARLAELRSQAAEAAERPLAYAAQPFDPPVTTLLARGDFGSPGEPVAAGGLSAIKAPKADFGLSEKSPEGERRLRLAAWLAAPENPLPARVMVNRIWQYHFGTGIVATAGDFGANGARPSHPALLDRLAADFLAGGGRIKPLHRRMVLSSAYRRSSDHRPEAAAIDPESRLLWRFPPRRIEGEAVLDAMLAASGKLSTELHGPSYRPFEVVYFNSSFYELTDPDTPETRRRTIYRMHVHSARSPLMESLDCPDPSVKTAKRTSTVTPLQALALMNDRFVERQARRFADRVAEEAGPEVAARVDRAFRIAFGRPPRPDEAASARELLQAHPLHRLAWALLNANEFLYLR
ncbi:MAG: DUF1553 domain-containing protein [Isosphaeraceae bacterium]|nr:DUF1553 domain-containing protein [Isosphaeraceae bacterium]